MVFINLIYQWFIAIPRLNCNKSKKKLRWRHLVFKFFYFKRPFKKRRELCFHVK